MTRELEEDIAQLTKRHSDVEQLSRAEDHLHLIQCFSSMTPSPPSKKWTEVNLPPSHWGSVRRAVVDVQEALSSEMKTLCADVELRRIQQYVVDVTLDPV